MKKILFSLALLTGLSVNAQLPDGSTCPDFTAVDIDGVTHNLYDYLDAGKTVIVDVSATWCGPCWAFHNAHVLRDMYYSYGQGGSGEVVILFVEGDASTTLAELHGGAGSQGDWVTGTPYPIIDDGAVADILEIGYFPTLYRICPDKIITNISPSEATGVQTYPELITNVESGCSVDLVGAQNNAAVDADDIVVCGTTSDVVATIENYGANTITAATLILKENGTEIANTSFAGSIASNGSGTATFNGVTINGSLSHTIEITTINGSAPFSATTGVAEVGVINSVQASGTAVTVTIICDQWGSETTWELKDDAGTVVISGGPYTDAAAAGLQAQTPVPAVLNPNACYTFTIDDSYGDGISSATYGLGTYTIKDAANVAIVSGGAFGATETKGFRAGVLGVEENVTTDISIFPNPSNGNVTIKSDNLTQFSTIELVDQTGRTLSTWNINSTAMDLEMGEISDGNYILVFKGDNGKTNQKIQINK